MIKFDKVDYAINNNIVLHNASLLVRSGGVTIVYCEREGGATTCAKLMCGLLSPTTGDVHVNGEAPSPQTVGASLLLADPIFVSKKTCLQNLEYAAKQNNVAISSETFAKVLAEFGLQPNQKPKKLSAKEKQLLAIARARVLNKKIVIADDILRNVPQEEKQIVLKELLEMSKGKTLVIFSSDNSLRIAGATKKYLHFGRFYSFLKPYQILQIHSMMEPASKTGEGTLKIKNKAVCIETAGKIFEVQNPSKAIMRAAKEREKVYYICKQCKIAAVYDYTDKQRL